MLLRRHKENYQPQSSILKKSEETAPPIEAPDTSEENQEEVEVSEASEKPDSDETTEMSEEKKKAGEKHGSAGKGKEKA